MKVAFCWNVINGYMSACWKELAQRVDVELLVIAIAKDANVTELHYAERKDRGYQCELIDAEEAQSEKVVKELLVGFDPDVLFICGWNVPAYRQIVVEGLFSEKKLIMTMDTNLKRNWRQKLAPVKIARYLKKMDYLYVPGERSWQLARYWGVSEKRIRRGSYSMDYVSFSRAYRRRLGQNSWPKKFLFVGQYIERKGLKSLLSAYSQYRDSVDAPWPLICCGSGPLASLLEKAAGVENRGFIDPGELPSVMAEVGAFIHPSTYDAWGVAIAEACAAGLPVVCTEGCASSLDLLRDFYNGRVVATGDNGELLSAINWVHANYERLPEFGRRSQSLAEPFGSEAWADRVMEMCQANENSNLLPAPVAR